MSDNMALTAPVMLALRDAVRTAIHTANEEQNGGFCTCNNTYFVRETDAAIAAAEPHFRAKHRAELYEELADEARSWAKEAEDRGAFLIAQTHLTLAMRFENRTHQQAEATRPDADEEVSL